LDLPKKYIVYEIKLSEVQFNEFIGIHKEHCQKVETIFKEMFKIISLITQTQKDKDKKPIWEMSPFELKEELQEKNIEIDKFIKKTLSHFLNKFS